MKNQSTGAPGIAMTDADVEALRGSLRGRLISPGHEAYEERRRVWTSSVTRRA